MLKRSGQLRRAPALRRAAPRARQSRQAQGAQTRGAILQAAVDLYASRGFRGTGLMTIGERAGVHHATVLYHFGSSRELLLAVLAERDRRFLESTQGAFSAGGIDALANLPVVARFHLQHPVWAKLFTVLQTENLDADAEGHDYFLGRRDAFRSLLIGLLDDAKRRRQIRADVDAAYTAETVLAFSNGAQQQHFLSGGALDLVALYEHFTTLLLSDLTRPRALLRALPRIRARARARARARPTRPSTRD